jgi:hypothetical protein
MAFTFKELKQLKNDIAAAMGIDPSIAARVIGYYNGGGRPDVVRAMIGGDLSHVGPALVALGYDLPAAMEPGTDNGSRESKTGESITASGDPVHTSGSASAGPVDNITAGSDMVTDGVVDDLHAGPDGFQNAPQRKESTQAAKRPTKQKKTNTSPQAVKGPDVVKGVHDDLGPDDLEHVQGESVNPHELPPGLYDDICATLENYCRQQNMDPGKVHPLQWKSACIYIGQSIKARGLLRDYEREKSHGGVLYDGVKVAALLDIYDYICGQYKQVPFVYNFPRFAGISPQYFADYENRLTSSRVNLYKKALDIQKAGLIDAVTGGGSATVGNIFLSKALAGLQETVTIQHVSTASTPAAVALPVFGPDGGLLEDKRPE